MTFTHEFGNSLNYILTLSQVAADDKNIPKDILENYFIPILNSGKIMHSMV